MTVYYRPLVQTGATRPEAARPVAGGWTWFDHAEELRRGQPGRIVHISELPQDRVEAISAVRAPMMGLPFARPLIMGILNVTPDSFSDGGQHARPGLAVARAQKMQTEGADIIDVGGESTRPGALDVAPEAEIARTQPVIHALRQSLRIPVSIDTRKSSVARVAMAEGANMINDVSGFTYDPWLAQTAHDTGAAVCLMHTQGTPRTMQDNPQYDDVLLDVYDRLEESLRTAEDAGIARARVVVDPGIGFGKTNDHNLALLRGISIFHGLGCPVLIGVSRKGLIREIGNAPDPEKRAPGSIALALGAVAQGVQIIRCHDIWETRQALDLAMAVTAGA